MIEKTLPSDSLKNRRQALRDRRRSRAAGAVGRFLAVGALAAGLAWVMVSPYWTLRSERQVEVEGENLLGERAIRDSLGLSYPLSLWEIPTDRLQEKLQTNPAIKSARIERQLFPPGMRVEIRERQPVARANSRNGQGYLDAEGTFIAKRYYDRPIDPALLVGPEAIGYQEQYRDSWRKLYPFLANLPVKVTVIDWRDPGNLVLKTDLGKVYFGRHDDRLAEKLTALVQARQLSSTIPLDRLLYLDLSDPNAPTVQVKPKPAPDKEKTAPVPR
ncbi:FtsQ-type POTRA domain-containing protein [Pannus brasiliensis CCIBt3594]|uniref:FtsQ-type POTRA domain-containing protein n=1 Tax=Pannus brasiliensis CCIBt3594 TaxID=1427578 RepID=A0AAW9R1W1_9CHRO